jgi:TonB family protein
LTTDAMKTRADEIGLTPIITLVVWAGFVAVGVLGKNVLTSQARSSKATKPAADVKLIDVAISNLPIVRSDAAPAPAWPPEMPIEPAPPEPPVVEAAPDMPGAPPLVDLAPPPAIVSLLPRPNEFSKPTSQPVAIATTAPSARSNAPAPAVAPAIRHLVYGQGAAVQPQPEYPLECAMAHQEGTVVVRFRVDDLGRVSDVQVATPSRWPLLNQAAARSVRQTWSFPPGAPGLYDVSIEYKLTEN